MIEKMVEAAQQPVVLWIVLGAAIFAGCVAAYKASHHALWGDIFGDESFE